MLVTVQTATISSKFKYLLSVNNYDLLRMLLSLISEKILKTDSLAFFSMNPEPLINRLKWFCRKINFREDIQIFSSKNSTPRNVSQRGVRLRVVLVNFGLFEKYSKVFRKINKCTQKSLEMEMFESTVHVSLCRVWLHAVLVCAESLISWISPRKWIF